MQEVINLHQQRSMTYQHSEPNLNFLKLRELQIKNNRYSSKENRLKTYSKEIKKIKCSQQ